MQVTKLVMFAGIASLPLGEMRLHVINHAGGRAPIILSSTQLTPQSQVTSIVLSEDLTVYTWGLPNSRRENQTTHLRIKRAQSQRSPGLYTYLGLFAAVLPPSF